MTKHYPTNSLKGLVRMMKITCFHSKAIMFSIFPAFVRFHIIALMARCFVEVGDRCMKLKSVLFLQSSQVKRTLQNSINEFFIIILACVLNEP